ncbi:SCO family protein, partial [Pseudomonas aeruginosa]
PQAVRDAPQVVFVSVDPNRETPQQIKQYLGYFNAGFQGLTGTPENIQKLANALSIHYLPANTSKPNYTVDHTRNLVIIVPDGRRPDSLSFLHRPRRSGP